MACVYICIEKKCTYMHISVCTHMYLYICMYVTHTLHFPVILEREIYYNDIRIFRLQYKNRLRKIFFPFFGQLKE